MKVSELTGATLDVWVAIALGEKRSERTAHAATAPHMYWLKSGEHGSRLCPQYSTNPRDGDPIIERERIATWGCTGSRWMATVPQSGGYRGDTHHIDTSEGYEAPTLLVAAMRASSESG
jgi:hypothetical protein